MSTTTMLKEIQLYGTPIFTIQSSNRGFEAVYGAVYHGPTQSWRFPAFNPVRDRVLDDLKKVTKGLVLPAPVPELTLPEDFSFITPPYQHQRDGLGHAYKYLRCGLFFAPGLGKCKIVTDLLRLVQEPALILCPRVMLYTWADELVKHGNITDSVVFDGAGTKKKKAQLDAVIAKTPTVLLTTYTTAARYYEQLLQVGYKVIIADESHQIKSPFSDRTKAAQALATRAYRRVLLSGTPSLGSPFDLYAQLRFLGLYFCPENWWEFRKKFGVFPAFEANEKVPKMLLGFKNLELMNERVNFVCLRKTKEECLDLPEQQIIDKRFALYHAQKKLYNSLILERADAAGYGVREDMDAGKLSNASGPVLQPHVLTPEIITLLGKIDQVSSGFLYQTTQNPRLCDGCAHTASCTTLQIRPYTNKCKIAPSAPDPVVFRLSENARLETLEELLEELLEDSANKVIIWATYKAELDDITAMLTKQKLPHVRVEGGIDAASLNARIKTFNEDPACRVYLGQVQTGIGITLNAANYMVYYSLPWSLEYYLQSLDRNYRIGQTRKVTVYRLLGQYTLDESKAAALDQKIDFANFVTSRGICATCPDYAKRCAKHNIQLYDDLCVHDRVKMRETAQVKLIP